MTPSALWLGDNLSPLIRSSWPIFTAFSRLRSLLHIDPHLRVDHPFAENAPGIIVRDPQDVLVPGALDPPVDVGHPPATHLDTDSLGLGVDLCLIVGGRLLDAALPPAIIVLIHGPAIHHRGALLGQGLDVGRLQGLVPVRTLAIGTDVDGHPLPRRTDPRLNPDSQQTLYDNRRYRSNRLCKQWPLRRQTSSPSLTS